jgi:3-deoxy-D-manno-octulosonic-acid transferase
LRYLYTFLFYLALPFILLRLLWRARKNPAYLKRWSERFGFAPQKLDQSIWLHAVSVGETIAAIPLIKALLAKHPGVPLVVTNMTPTGAARVKAAFKDQVIQTYIPYDLPDMVHRFIDRIRPRILIVMETELWPNLYAASLQKSIPIVVTNARLSHASAVGYHRITPLTREMFQAITLLLAQAKADADRFIALGLSEEKVHVTGNLKFDLEIPEALFAKCEALREKLGKARFIWIAASTHPGEEEILLAAHQHIKKHQPDALLILVPRHPERFSLVATLAEQQGFHVIRRSQNASVTEKTDVYLGDTMGELLLMYGAADVAFVGGSFVNVGGHNMLEPAALSKPILTGPILFNFADISDLLLKAGEKRAAMGEKAFTVLKQNRGALERQVEKIESLLQSP